MHRPLIGILPSINEGGRLILTPTYMNVLWESGALGCIIEPTTDVQKIEEYKEIFDGFLISGGVDIHPSYYGEEIKFDSVHTDKARDDFESIAVKEFYSTGKPILGICRGLQALNVFLGGTLYQHIDNHKQEEAGSVQTHSVDVLAGSMLGSITGEEKIMVNTFHHQNIKDLAPSLVADAYSYDGYIEAAHDIEHKFCIGVQWHPEMYCANDEAMKKLFISFVDACKK